MSRSIHASYQDPLDVIWLRCARELGLTVQRSDEVYASFDGQGTLTLSTSAHFDADDSLAQLIFHELCHALVAGPKRMKRADWGMENVDDRDLLDEHACHRLQAALADACGLRALLAVTTDHRSYWDALPVDPLAHGEDPAIPVARDAHERATRGAWSEPIARALRDTAKVAALLREGAPEDSLWARTQPLHASGFPVDVKSEHNCGECGFSFTQGNVLRCRKTRALPHSVGKRVASTDKACVRFEPQLTTESCETCGACCREAFDRVDVSARDLVKRKHAQLVSVDGYGAHLARPHGMCVALDAERAAAERYRCRIYDDRPKSCADFAVASDACLTARRRVGLSA